MNDLKRYKELGSVYFAGEVARFKTQQSPELFVGNTGDTNRAKGGSDSMWNLHRMFSSCLLINSTKGMIS